MKMYDLDKVKKIFLEINPDASIELEDVRRLEHYMYADCENLFLTRKRNKIEKRLRLVAQ